MPQIDPTEYSSLRLEAFSIVRGFELHDVWRVELDGAGSRTLQELRERIREQHPSSMGLGVRGLFRLRSMLGRIFRLDEKPGRRSGASPLTQVPRSIASRSVVPPGTAEGPFTTLYAFPREAAYEALNATVHAILVVALVTHESGQRFYWATYVRSVGRITRPYMRAIDPFRRWIVYPGLEAWLKRVWTGSRE